MIALSGLALVTGYLPGALHLPPADPRSPSTRRPRPGRARSSGRSSSARPSPYGLAGARGRRPLSVALRVDRRPACRGGARRRRAAAPLRRRQSRRLVGAAPLALVALTLWVFPPPSEYIIGGKDPGVYLNAGVQIAQRGNLIITTRSWRACRPKPVACSSRSTGRPYYSNRFMGFFLHRPRRGHGHRPVPSPLPTAVAIGYDMAGLTGARYTATVCACWACSRSTSWARGSIGRPPAL